MTSPLPGLERFSTAEVAAIIGAPEETLRTWRARGLMPQDRHWAGSYDSLQLCALAIRKALVSQGESPRDTASLGPRYAPWVLVAALRHAGRDHEAEAAIDALIASSPEPTGRFLAALDHRSYRLFASMTEVMAPGAASVRLIDLEALGLRVAALAQRPLLRTFEPDLPAEERR